VLKVVEVKALVVAQSLAILAGEAVSVEEDKRDSPAYRNSGTITSERRIDKVMSLAVTGRKRLAPSSKVYDFC
jgi:hypothetical protein